MKIEDIKNKYNQKEKNKISKYFFIKKSNDIIRATEKLYVLGNASVIDKQYVCTVPIELNNNIS